MAALARAKGFKNVPALAWRMGVQRQGIYAIWNGTARQVSLDILARLAFVLGAGVGDWFVWARPRAESQVLRTEEHSAAPNAQHPALVWNVRSRMEWLGLDPTRLGFRAELYGQSIMPIVEGGAQAVSVEALGKLARALDAPVRPFVVGELFLWHNDTGSNRL